MKPNTKKLRDNPVKVNLNHYEYQVMEACSSLSGEPVATLVARLAMSKIREMTIFAQPIAMLMTDSNKIELPMNHFLTPK